MDEEDGERLQWNSAVRKKARLPLAPAHRNLEGGMLSDTNQTSRVRLRLSAKPAEVELTEAEQDGGGRGQARGAGKGGRPPEGSVPLRAALCSAGRRPPAARHPTPESCQERDRKCPRRRQETVPTRPSVPKRLGFDPWSGTSPRGHSSTLQYSRLERPADRGARHGCALWPTGSRRVGLACTPLLRRLLPSM